MPCLVSDSETDAIRVYAESIGIDTAGINSDSIFVHRWARLQLPDKHIAHSAWKEKCCDPQKLHVARNVKVDKHIH